MVFGECYFKYTPRLEFLDNSKFRFTQPSQLNDPLECYPQILMEAYAPEDIEEAKEQVRKMGITAPADIERLYLKFVGALPRRRITPEEFPGISYPPGIRSMAELDKEDAKRRLDELMTHINETYGIFCLSESCENVVMWSWYAGSHKGLVVGFDANHPFFKAAHDFYPVEYSDQRISLSSNEGLLRLAGYQHSASQYKDLPVRLFLRKSKEWAHEREWRMIRKLDEYDSLGHGNPPVYLFKIPRQAIRVIILGARMSPDNAVRIRELISTPAEWSHVQLFQAALPSSGYELEVKPYASSGSSPAK